MKKGFKAGGPCEADISNHRGQNIENEERRERLRRILESRKAKSVNDQEKVQSAAWSVILYLITLLLFMAFYWWDLLKDNINGTSNDAKKAK